MVNLADIWQGIDGVLLAIGCGIVLASWGLRYIALVLIDRWLERRKQAEAPKLNEPVLKAAIGYGIVLAGLIVGLTIAALPDEPLKLNTYTWRILNTLLIIYCGAMAYTLALGIFRAYLRRARSDEVDTLEERILPIVRDLFKLVVVVLIVALGIQVWGYSPATLLAGVGIGGLALAFAAQDTVANIFGSFVIFSDRPFKVGDWVELSGVAGVVEEIGIRSTRVRTFDKCLVSIPNKLISEEKLFNWQAMTQRRVRFHLGVSAANPPEAIERALGDLRELVSGTELVTPGMWVVYTEQVSDSKLGILVQAYLNTKDYEPYLRTQEQLILGALKVLRQHGLSVAVPLEVQSMPPETEHLGVPRVDG